MSKKAVTPSAQKVYDTEEIVEQIKAQFKIIGEKHVVNRSVELDVIMLGLLTKRHVMLDGPPGTGKTMLVEAALSIFGDDSTQFFKQLLPGTMPEEVFGPINPKKFREEGRIQFETAGYLPSAHFAFIDEVYRGPDAVLNSLLMMLNERRFKNGALTVSCPLMTCIGTTNFVSRADILHAFRDRWFITTSVCPADGKDGLKRIADAFLAKAKYKCEEHVRIDELQAVQRAIVKREIPPEILDLYIELVVGFKKAGLSSKGNEVTDRRFAEGLHAVQAGLFMFEKNIDAIMLMARYVLLQSNDKTVIAAFDNTYNSVVGDYRRSYEEAPRIKSLRDAFKVVRDMYSEKKPKSQLEELKSQLAEVSRAAEESSFSLQSNVQKHSQLRTEIRELNFELSRALGETPEEPVSDDKEVNELFASLLAESKGS